MEVARLVTLFCGLAPLVGCADSFAGDLVVTDVRLAADQVEVDVRNVGRSGVWVWTAPHRLDVDAQGGSIVVALHGDEPGSHLASVVALQVAYERLDSPRLPFGDSRTTLAIPLPSSVASEDEQGGRIETRLEDLSAVFVEVGWSNRDPGSHIAEDAPSSIDVVVAEWSSESG